MIIARAGPTLLNFFKQRRPRASYYKPRPDAVEDLHLTSLGAETNSAFTKFVYCAFIKYLVLLYLQKRDFGTYCFSRFTVVKQLLRL